MTDWAMWKPVLTALAMPLVPFLVLGFWASLRLWRGRADGWLWGMLCAAGLWLSHCMGTAVFLQAHVLHVPEPLKEADVLRIRQAVEGGHKAERVGKLGRVNAQPPAAPPVAIVVLGGGLQPLAPERGVADLSEASLVRLRHGLWLARQTGAPVAFSGGVGWAQKGVADGAGEAEVAQRIATQEFGMKLRWVETESADTQGNAERTMAMLADEGVRHVVLVSSAYHLPRARALFERAARHESERHPGGAPFRIEPAATGYWTTDTRPVLTWMPSATGAASVMAAWREVLGGWVQR